MSLLDRVVALTTENTSLKQQVKELKNELYPEPERVLTEAEKAVLADAKPETEAEAIAALDAVKAETVLSKPGIRFKAVTDTIPAEGRGKDGK